MAGEDIKGIILCLNTNFTHFFGFPGVRWGSARCSRVLGCFGQISHSPPTRQIRKQSLAPEND